jgi:hypothetical protein
MGNLADRAGLIRRSICYHQSTDPDAVQACADRFQEAARAVSNSIRLERLSEDLFARERVA